MADQDSLVNGLSKKQDERDSFLPNLPSPTKSIHIDQSPPPSKFNTVTLTKELCTN